MAGRPVLVKNPDEIIANIIRFNEAVFHKEAPELTGCLSRYREWCYSKKLCMLAPVRYVAYSGMTLDKFLDCSGLFDNKAIRRIAENFMTELDSDSPLGVAIRQRLEDMHDAFFQVPNRSARVHLLE